MPDQTYEVVMHDGRKFRVVADHAPTEEEILAHLPATEAAAPKLMASHEAPVDKAGLLDTALGVVGRSVGIPGVGGGGPVGEAAAQFTGNPKNAPAIAAMAAAPATAGMSLPAAAAVTGVAGGGGSIAKNAAEYFLGKGPSSLGEAATDVAKDAAIQGGSQLAGGLIAKGLEAAAPRVMSAVLKPGTRLRAQNEGMDIPLEAVKQGAVISKGGLAAQSDKVRGLNQQVKNAIAASNATVKPSEVYAPVADLLRERQALGPVAAGDANKIQEALVDLVGADAPMPISQTQGIKKYAAERVKFGTEGASPVAKDILQRVRVGAKQAVANAEPAVDELNQQLAPAIAVRKALAQRLGTAQNTNVVPARVFMAHNPVLSAISAVTGAPSLASRGANLMYRTGQAQVPPQAIRAALLAMMGGDEPPQP
jgi:hypothetical protein